MLLRLACVLLLGLCGFAGAQSSPLIMDHADSLAAQRKAGFLLLKGGVRFHHDSIQFRTERATWNKLFDMVTCEGGFDFRHPQGTIMAKTGSYMRKQELATAVGSVTARDSAGEYAYFGERLLYDRKKQILTLPELPVMHQYQKNSKGGTDTLAIKAKHIVYDQGKQFAVATGDVRITKDDMVVTSDTGYYDRGKGFMALRGRPRCSLKGYVLTGDSMHIELDGESIRTVLVVNNAHGVQDEDPGNGKPLQHSEVQGDTLFVEFKKKKAQRLYVNNSARGLFYESDLAEFINRMSGNRLDIAFDDGKMRTAVVKGEARSTYFYATDERKVAGRNESAGDTIHIEFDTNQVKSLKVMGNLATGIYYDLSKKSKRNAGPVKPGGATDIRTPGSSREDSAAEKDAQSSAPGPAANTDKATERARQVQEKLQEALRKRQGQ